MKIAYICCKFKGEIERNLGNAKLYSRLAYRRGYIPIVTHLFLNEATGLTDDKNRQKILEICKRIIEKCDVLLVFGEISEGMEEEIYHANMNGVKVIYSDFEKEDEEGRIELI